MVAKYKIMVRTVHRKRSNYISLAFETTWLFEICTKKEIRPTKVRKFIRVKEKKAM
jgi:hypothetical protein